MATNAYTGLPRSGKSYGVVENVIVPALQKGRCVWTNIPIVEDKMAAFAGALPHAFHVNDIRDNPAWFQDVLPKGVVLVLDEAWRVWPSGMKATNITEGHKSFFAEHGHMVGEDNFVTEIYLVTQDLAQLAAFIRQLVDTTYRSHKLAALGANKHFRVDIYDGAVTGQKPPVSKRVRVVQGKYKPEIYALYKSHTMSETGAAGDETSSDGRKNIFRGFAAKGMIAIIVLGSIFAFMGISKVRDYYAPHEVVAAAAAPGAPVRALPVRQEKGFLDGRTVVIAGNGDVGKGPQFVFRVDDNRGSSRLTVHDLAALGYSLGVVNECLVIVNGFGQRLYAQCQRDRPREGLNLVAATTDAATASN